MSDQLAEAMQPALHPGCRAAGFLRVNRQFEGTGDKDPGHTVGFRFET